GCEQKQDFRLDRVRVLELVHEHVTVALAQLAAGGGALAQQLCGEQQQVLEQQPSRAPPVSRELLACAAGECECDRIPVRVPRARRPAANSIPAEECPERVAQIGSRLLTAPVARPTRL